MDIHLLHVPLHATGKQTLVGALTLSSYEGTKQLFAVSLGTLFHYTKAGKTFSVSLTLYLLIFFLQKQVVVCARSIKKDGAM